MMPMHVSGEESVDNSLYLSTESGTGLYKLVQFIQKHLPKAAAEKASTVLEEALSLYRGGAYNKAMEAQLTELMEALSGSEGITDRAFEFYGNRTDLSFFWRKDKAGNRHPLSKAYIESIPNEELRRKVEQTMTKCYIDGILDYNLEKGTYTITDRGIESIYKADFIENRIKRETGTVLEEALSLYRGGAYNEAMEPRLIELMKGLSGLEDVTDRAFEFYGNRTDLSYFWRKDEAGNRPVLSKTEIESIPNEELRRKVEQTMTKCYIDGVLDYDFENGTYTITDRGIESIYKSDFVANRIGRETGNILQMEEDMEAIARMNERGFAGYNRVTIDIESLGAKETANGLFSRVPNTKGHSYIGLPKGNYFPLTEKTIEAYINPSGSYTLLERNGAAQRTINGAELSKFYEIKRHAITDIADTPNAEQAMPTMVGSPINQGTVEEQRSAARMVKRGFAGCNRVTIDIESLGAVETKNGLFSRVPNTKGRSYIGLPKGSYFPLNEKTIEAYINPKESYMLLEKYGSEQRAINGAELSKFYEIKKQARTDIVGVPNAEQAMPTMVGSPIAQETVEEQRSAVRMAERGFSGCNRVTIDIESLGAVETENGLFSRVPNTKGRLYIELQKGSYFPLNEKTVEAYINPTESYTLLDKAGAPQELINGAELSSFYEIKKQARTDIATTPKTELPQAVPQKRAAYKVGDEVWATSQYEAGVRLAPYKVEYAIPDRVSGDIVYKLVPQLPDKPVIYQTESCVGVTIFPDQSSGKLLLSDKEYAAAALQMKEKLAASTLGANVASETGKQITKTAAQAASKAASTAASYSTPVTAAANAAAQVAEKTIKSITR